VIKPQVKRVSQTIFADTIALFLFSVCAGIPTLFYEILIAKLTLEQWAGVRIFYNILRFAGAYFCAKLTDKIRRRLPGHSNSRFQKAVADTIALSLYQFPIYIISALIMGAKFRQIAIMSTVRLVDTIMLGWLYGIFLDWARSRFADRVNLMSNSV